MHILIKSIKFQIKGELNTFLYFVTCFIINYSVIQWNIQINLVLYLINILFFIGIYIKYKNINALKAIFIIAMVIMGDFAVLNKLHLSFTSIFITLIFLIFFISIYYKLKKFLIKSLPIFILSILYVILLILLFIYKNNTLYLLTLFFSSFNFFMLLKGLTSQSINNNIL